MATLSWVLLGVLGLATLGILILMKWRYDGLCEEVERDAGWHRMWHERIWQDEDEPRG